MEKVTKADKFDMVREIVAASDNENKDELIEFLDRELELLNAKAEKARERQIQKRAAGDELKARIKAVLTDEFQTIDAITTALDEPEITKSMVSPRLNALAKEGFAEKSTVKADSRRVVAYRAILDI